MSVLISESHVSRISHHDPVRLAEGGSPAFGFHVLAALVLLTVTALRLWYLVADCPYDLAPDEAHYWDWSRHLDWSYYSKGPVVAYLIAGSCALFGDHAAAVRLPAVICGTVTLLGLYVLTFRVYRSERLALGVILFVLTMPLLAAGSLLMTIDAPYVCCWTWALVLAHRVTLSSVQPTAVGGLTWVLLGLVVGIGILAKYTMVLFLPSLGLFLLMGARHSGNGDRSERRWLGLPGGYWLMCFVAGFCCLPIVIWNAQNGWVTLLHVGRQAGVQNGSGIRWLGPLEFLGGQAAVLLGVWFVVWVAAMIGRLRLCTGAKPQVDAPSAFLWWMSAPTFVIFLGFSFTTRVEINWPMTAYLSGLVLTAGWLAERWSAMSRGLRLVLKGAAVAGLTATVLIHHAEWLYPLLPSPDPSASLDLSTRRWDPTCRLRGWRTLAAEVGRIRDEIRVEGIEPVLAAAGWALPGEIAFYLPDHPIVYSFALANGGRRSQYDFWRPNPVFDPEQFKGRTVILIGEMSPGVRAAFAHVNPSRQVVHYVGGRAVAAWQINVCRDFRGIAQLHLTGY